MTGVQTCTLPISGYPYGLVETGLFDYVPFSGSLLKRFQGYTNVNPNPHSKEVLADLNSMK